MSSRTFIATEEVNQFQRFEDRLTLLLGANTAGDLKLKPTLIYYSESSKKAPKVPKIFAKSSLPVL